ncbi:MAG: nucleoside triphosphate pyrophosphohydrolase [Candidatus Rifleibacteriota bacterium]
MTEAKSRISNELMRLVEIMERLRSPDGCSWDRKQTHRSLAKFVKEEAEEAVEAIESGDTLHMVEELGDLLMIIVFHSQIGAEEGTFTLADVARGICEKLIARHPHVFGEVERGLDPDQVLDLWGKLKKTEKENKGKISNRMKEALNFPSAIKLTEKIQQEAARVGFDFPAAEEAFRKVREETEEVGELLQEDQNDNLEAVQEEVGDLLFSIINFTRLRGLDAEKCLRLASKKFVNRFAHVEEMVEKDGGFAGKKLEELDKYWDKIKLSAKHEQEKNF